MHMGTEGENMPVRYRLRWSRFVRDAGLAFVLTALHLNAQSLPPVTVADTIAMTELVSQGAGLHDFMHLSPDGERFAVVVKRGDVQSNERVFSLMVFRATAVFEEPGETVAVMRSSSNDDAISDVRWLNNGTLTF